MLAQRLGEPPASTVVKCRRFAPRPDARSCNCLLEVTVVAEHHGKDNVQTSQHQVAGTNRVGISRYWPGSLHGHSLGEAQFRKSGFSLTLWWVVSVCEIVWLTTL